MLDFFFFFCITGNRVYTTLAIQINQADLLYLIPIQENMVRNSLKISSKIVFFFPYSFENDLVYVELDRPP